MIRKTPKGYVIYSESGKRLSKPYKTRPAAQRRLQQIEYFKHRGGLVDISLVAALIIALLIILAMVIL